MGIWDTVKDVVTIAQKADNVDLLKHVLELQSQLGELIEERRGLKEENGKLRQQLAVQDSLFFEDNAYWKCGDGTKRVGPYCTRCYAVDGKVVPMHFMHGNGYHVCPSCKTSTLLPENRHLAEPSRRNRGDEERS